MGSTLLLSQLLGSPVTTSGGAGLGRLKDLVVRLEPDRPRVAYLLFRASGATYCVVSTADAADVGRGGVHLLPGLRWRRYDRPEEIKWAADDVLLARDVLDTQVVDLHGLRLARVSDVLLSQVGNDLEVVAVDLGLAGLLRRVGLGRLVRRQRPVLVDWADLHLTSPRGHAVQLCTSASPFRRLDAAGLAELVARLPATRAADVLHRVDPAVAAEVVHRSRPDVGRLLVQTLGSSDQDRLLHAAQPEHRQTVHELARLTSPLRGRRFLRSSGWLSRRPPSRR